MIPSNRIAQTFDRLHQLGEKALIPYLMAGDPSLSHTESYVLALEQAGADLIELGVPFSDPIADGPVIQQAAERALRAGTTLKGILSSVQSLRQHTHIPLILMTYYNPVLAMGNREFCRQAVQAGVDGVIVPDLPPEEANVLSKEAHLAGLTIIYLLTPTSTKPRQETVIKQTHGFIYYVSLLGITGAQLDDVALVRKNVTNIQKTAHKPVAVGFGISTPEKARQIADFADGVIVGSAIVRIIGEQKPDASTIKQLTRLTQGLKSSLHFPAH